MKLEIPAYFTNTQTQNMERAGMDVPWSNYDVKRVVLYDVSYLSISTDPETGDVTTIIGSGDSSFATPLPREVVEKAVDEMRTYSGVASRDLFSPWANNQIKNGKGSR